MIGAFISEALPGVEPDVVELASDLIETTLTQVGSSFSEALRTDEEIESYATAMADMFVAYLKSLAKRAE